MNCLAHLLTPKVVGDVLHGRTWRHVEGPILGVDYVLA